MKKIREESQGHITKEMFTDWQDGRMTDSQEAGFLGHIGVCTFCAEQFGTWMETGGMMMEPPKYLEDEIQARTRQLDIRTAVRVKETSRQMKLMMYSLKVGLAVAASIFLLTVTTGVQKMNIEAPSASEKIQQNHQQKEEKESITRKLSRGSSYVADALNQLTEGLFHIEFSGPQKGQNQEEEK